MKTPESYLYVLGATDPADPSATATGWLPLIATPEGVLYNQLVSPNTDQPVDAGPMGSGIDIDEEGLDVRSTVHGLEWLGQTGLNAVTASNVGLVSLDPSLSAGLVIALNTNSFLFGYDLDSDDGTQISVNVAANAASLGDGWSGNVLSISMLYAHDGGAGGFTRLQSASATNTSAASGNGALTSTGPGEWSINHTPAANTQATISRAAGGAGVRHVCKSITASGIGLAAAAETTVLVNLRDGATGAGTILWSQRVYIPAGGQNGFAFSDLNIVGSANTAMTLEFAAAGGADTFESVALTGFDVS